MDSKSSPTLYESIAIKAWHASETWLSNVLLLHCQGYDTPLVADIHFQPKVAMDVADAFEKIRINPGNFVDGRKTFDEYVYDSKVRSVTPWEVMLRWASIGYF